MGEKKSGRIRVCVSVKERECKSVRVGGGREREYDDGGEKVGDGRGKERGGMAVCV